MTMIRSPRKCCSAAFEKFRSIVDRDYLKNLMLSEIAEKMDLSAEHLMRVYSAETASSPPHYLNKRC